MAEWIHIHKAVNANDAANPANKSGVAVQGIHRVKVAIKIGGSDSPSWDVTPIFWNEHEDADQYFDDDKRIVASDEMFILEVGASEDLYFRVDNQQGTSPVIDIWVKLIA